MRIAGGVVVLLAAILSFTSGGCNLAGAGVSKGGRSATFLPQVAPEQGWDRDTTLEHLSRKAGLGLDGWKEGATFEVYEAIVFSEGDH